MVGFKSFDAAQGTLVGRELMHMLKKKQMVREAGDKGLTAAALFYSPAAESSHRQGQRGFHDHLSNMCDTARTRARGRTGGAPCKMTPARTIETDAPTAARATQSGRQGA